jgi:hypothetical protein
MKKYKDVMKKLMQQTYTILTVLLFVWQGSTVIAQCNHPDDYTALRALYLATDGDNWTIKTGWPTQVQFLVNPTPPVGTDMDGWYQIQCKNGRVSGIGLSSNQLRGTIPNMNMPNLESYHQNSLKNDVPFNFICCPLFILLMNLHTFSV